MATKNKIGQGILNIIFILLCIAAVSPFLLLLSSSLTDEETLLRAGYNFIPAKFSLQSYEYLMGSAGKITGGYGITVFVTLVGTVAGMFMTIMFAYPLSRKELPKRTFFSFFVFFTMLFNGGLVPTYMMWTQTFHVRNTLWED